MKVIMGIVCIVLIYIFISVLWTIGEKLLYGKSTPRVIDDVVALILSVSLYLNFTGE